ncbi:hypothetical protein E2929_21110 [Escherichia coli]|nr:hypothetical protein [Escherichia coli]EFA5213314.1 hypothetical protein [Escherichia coli]EFC2234727.1 hypothetical protein [Escherichia coli]MCI5458202.1 hypothetical protein [Escherichia coli]TJB64541.1 hypothetical protein C9284_27210 [Escherichia coli]
MEHLCCSEVSISPLFRWPNSVCHYIFRKPVLRLFKDAIISLHPQVLEFLWWYNHLQSRLRSRPGPPLS